MRRRVSLGVDTIVGLDLSLTAAGCCAIPRLWTKQNMSRIRTEVFGYSLTRESSPTEQARRIEYIASNILKFCKTHEACAVFVEEYAFAQGKQSNAHALAELGGVVKNQLMKELHLFTVPLIASSARKILLQRLPGPRGKPKGYMKKWVAKNVRRLGGPTFRWTEDEIDAFVIANAGLMQDGGLAMTFLGRD